MLDRIPTAQTSSWIDPDDSPPPIAKKMLLLTKGGIAVIGNWGNDCVAWAPLPKIPPKLKEKLLDAIRKC